MDLGSFEITDEAVATMTVYDPRDRMRPLLDGKGNPLTVQLLSADSPRARDAARKARVKALMDRPIQGATVEEAADALRNAEKRDLETLVALTTGWSGIGFGDDETPFSPEACLRAYGKLPWLVEQVNSFLNNRANFMKASRKV
jgi:hypothetical protein